MPYAIHAVCMLICTFIECTNYIRDRRSSNLLKHLQWFVLFLDRRSADTVIISVLYIPLLLQLLHYLDIYCILNKTDLRSKEQIAQHEIYKLKKRIKINKSFIKYEKKSRHYIHIKEINKTLFNFCVNCVMIKKKQMEKERQKDKQSKRKTDKVSYRGALLLKEHIPITEYREASYLDQNAHSQGRGRFRGSL